MIIPEDRIRDLRRQYDVILRTTGAFFLFGEHAVMYGQPAVYMPIPLYGYVALRRNQNDGLDLNIETRPPESENLRDFRWHQDEKKILEKRMGTKLEESGFRRNYDVQVVSGLPGRCGLNSSGALSTGISVGVHLLEGRLTPWDIEEWKKIEKLNDFKNINSFVKVFSLAKQIDSVIQGSSSGIGPFAALIGAQHKVPFIYLTGGKIDNDDYPEFFAYSLQEISKVNFRMRFSKWSYALLFSGKESQTRDAFSTLRKEIDRSCEAMATCGVVLKKKDLPLERIAEPFASLLRNVGDSEEKEESLNYFFNKLTGILGGIALTGIGNFISDVKGDQIERLMCTNQAILAILGLSNDDIRRICSEFSHKGFGSKLTGSGVGGDVVIFTSNYGDRESLVESVDNSRYYCHFKSWEAKDQPLNGIEIDGMNPYIEYPLIRLDESQIFEEAIIGVVPYIVYKNIPEYENQIHTPEKKYKKLKRTLNNVFKDLDDVNEKLHVLLLPESILPEEGSKYSKLAISMMEDVAKQRDIIIIGGTYKKINHEDVCPIITSSSPIYHQSRLHKAGHYEGKNFKFGVGIWKFYSGAIGTFNIMVCYDFTNKTIEDIIYRFSHSKQSCHTVFVPACNPGKRTYEERGPVLSKSLHAHIFIADSFGKKQKSVSMYAPFKDDYDKVYRKLKNITLYKIYPRDMEKSWREKNSIYVGPPASQIHDPIE